ncbi:hypothetical protein DAEQUDRAFT_764076 [Daedalea quercina L-15889]|uniref:Uncharacterized protein n=1 Tax=Daedalea quercina L-15889 TaxID=1314783 RepID=A0A165RTQ3_9APHY|nr:hypothetical protein DAEQUDRAFT_764076 [Daedalea quercina L-15889]
MAVGYAIDHFLEKVGNGLKELRLLVFVLGYCPPLASSGLETIHLDIYISEDTQDLKLTLYTITYALSSIKSRHLRNIHLELWFTAIDEFTTFDVDPAVSDFLRANPLASVFSRDIFNGEQVPKIYLVIYPKRRKWSPIMDAAVHILPALFEPWC